MAIVFDKRQRNPGTYISASVASTLVPQGQLTVTGLLDASDLADAALEIGISVEANDDPGGNGPWYVVVASRWTGGHVDRAGNPIPPKLTYSPGVVTATRLRGTIDINKRIWIELEMTVA